MADAVEVAAFVGPSRVDHALGVAAAAGRFAEADLAAIVDHYATEPDDDLVVADEGYSAQPGTNAWAGFTTTSSVPTSSVPTSKETI